jgi:shikimate kinase
MNIVLIGYRGAGKSEVARALAERLAWQWFDSDDEVERRAGKSIATIFAEQGESAFRDLESHAVLDLAQRDHAVMALGGGAILRIESREAIKRHGKIVWLTASGETLWRRINADPATVARRPPLSASGGITEILATLEAREGIYRACADLEVDTENRTCGEVADAIVAQLELGSPSEKPA